MVIYKYFLWDLNYTTAIPKTRTFLSAQNQDDQIVLWYMVDEQDELENVEFLVLPTGQKFESKIIDSFIFRGTVQISGLVWHVWEKQNE